MIKIKKIACVSLLWTTFVLGAVVNPSQSTMAILLDASGMCNDSSSDTWKNMAMGDLKGANTLTKFTYDAYNKIKKMEVSVDVNGTESVVTTEILRMQKSDNVPDTMFEF